MVDDARIDDPWRETAVDPAITEVCERFEGAWRAGDRPVLEDYLGETSGAERTTLFGELLAVELSHLQRSGQIPPPGDYQRRFPGFEEVIEKTLAFGEEPSGPRPTSSGVTLAGEERRLAPGEDPRIPGYECLAEVGRGGMGVVYRARQLQLDRICALKTVSAVGSIGDEAALRFLAEAKAIATVRHPNVVQVHHAAQHEGRLFFEMEYVEGGSLAHRLKGVAWPPSRAARLIDAVARAVDEVHHHRIVHRDLKPANILLMADGTPKVADFGLAKSLDRDASLTLEGVILGTPSYMAPEQAEGLADLIGPATDIYAVGAILYELLAGRPPFTGASKLEVIQKIKAGDPPPPSDIVPGIPADLDAVCLKCLAKSPADRYATAGDLADDLRRFITGDSTLARPAAEPAPAPRRSLLVPGLAVAAVVVALVVAGVVLSRRDTVGIPPGPAADPAPKQPGIPYVVKPGEYPFSIATRLLGDGERWTEMRKENGRPLTAEDARNLLPGETLYLPPFDDR